MCRRDEIHLLFSSTFFFAIFDGFYSPPSFVMLCSEYTIQRTRICVHKHCSLFCYMLLHVFLIYTIQIHITHYTLALRYSRAAYMCRSVSKNTQMYPTFPSNVGRNTLRKKYRRMCRGLFKDKRRRTECIFCCCFASKKRYEYCLDVFEFFKLVGW